ncbi:MAG: ribonuclease III domain-containing protein [Negativicutes bacterium]|nr:ribonuclease III domain-containing protein [Negativicutes bacterium]
MKFDQFEFLARQTFAVTDQEGVPAERFGEVEARLLPPLVLAYIGDAFFNLFVRTKLLHFEQNKVRVLHNHGARMVSATLQAHALKVIEPGLGEAELDIVRRGRNAKSTVPKSASVGDYRSSTGFEALLGYLYLEGYQARLQQLAEQAFVVISREIANPIEKDGEKK